MGSHRQLDIFAGPMKKKEKVEGLIGERCEEGGQGDVGERSAAAKNRQVKPLEKRTYVETRMES